MNLQDSRQNDNEASEVGQAFSLSAVSAGCVSFPLTLALPQGEGTGILRLLKSGVVLTGTVCSAIQRRDASTTRRVRFATQRRAILPPGGGAGGGGSNPPQPTRVADRR